MPYSDDHKLRLAVFISGNGSNLQAILDACRSKGYPAEVVVVVSNEPEAFGLSRAAADGIPTLVVPHRKYRNRCAHEEAILKRLDPYKVDLVVLAGYMRVVSSTLLKHFHAPDRTLPGVINIHPADARIYQGTHGYEFALGLLPDYPTRLLETRITVHFVDEGVDTGPIISQETIPVCSEDNLGSLRARGLQIEHRLYPKVIRWYAEGRIQLDGGSVKILPALKE
jgi:phosphoribosylglycinamide formyltransferase 1